MVFESRRKQTLVEAAPAAPSIRPHAALALRDEVDPDPFIEEMVARLRDGLGSLQAIDEWGRPMSWRNIVRMAVGPTVAQLRDAQTATGIAVSLLPGAVEPPTDLLEEPADLPGQQLGWPAQAHADWEPLPEPVAPAVASFIEEPPAPVVVDPVAPAIEEVAVPVVEVVAEPVAELAAESRPDVIAGSTPDVAVEPSGAAAAQRPADSEYAGSLFRVSGDQRSVPVSAFTPSQVLRQSGAHDSTTAKYDRFLTSLYGVPKADPQD